MDDKDQRLWSLEPKGTLMEVRKVEERGCLG
jgi:hypothetical protein